MVGVRNVLVTLEERRERDSVSAASPPWPEVVSWCSSFAFPRFLVAIFSFEWFSSRWSGLPFPYLLRMVSRRSFEEFWEIIDRASGKNFGINASNFGKFNEGLFIKLDRSVVGGARGWSSMVFKGSGRESWDRGLLVKICRISVKVITLKGRDHRVSRGDSLPGFLREARKGSRDSFWRHRGTNNQIEESVWQGRDITSWRVERLGTKGCLEVDSLEVGKGEKRDPHRSRGGEGEKDENTDFNGEYSNYCRIYSIWLLSARVYSSNCDPMSRLSSDFYWGYRPTPFDRWHSLLYLESNARKHLWAPYGDSSRARW